MNKEYMLKLSRDLIKAFVERQEIKLSMEHYFMFSVTKFLLTKESIIKKNCNDNTITFDTSNQYLGTILTEYHYISKNLKYKVDGVETYDEVDDSVILENVPEKTEEEKKFKRYIKEAVWCIDKIRDSFAHGKYSFDIKNHLIVIDNEYDTFDVNGKVKHHSFKCSFPPELISMLGKRVKSENEVILEQFEDKGLINKYNNDFKKLDNTIKLKYDSYKKINKLNDFYKNDDKLNKYDREGKVNKKAYNKDKPLSIMSKELYVHNQAISVMAETVSTMNLDASEESVLTSILYNHLLLLLSDETKEYDYSNLLLLGLNYKFAPSKDEKNKSDDITNTKGPIKKAAKTFNNNYAGINEHGRVKRCKELFEGLYNKLTNQFGIRNKSVIKRIRNSIMHGHIEVKNGVIKLYDRSDKTDNESPNQFDCTTDNKGLLELINELETKKKYTLQAFMIEIDKLLTSFEMEDDFIDKTLTNIFLCLKSIDHEINLNTEMSSIFENKELDKLRKERERLVNVLRNIKDLKESEGPTL